MNACHKGKNHIAKFQDNPMLKEKNKNKNKKWQSKASWFNSTSMCQHHRKQIEKNNDGQSRTIQM